MNKKFIERDTSIGQEIYKNVYEKSHLTEGAYSGIINSIDIEYLYEYLGEINPQALPKNMEDLNELDLSPVEAIRKALYGRSFGGGDFNLNDSYIAEEDDGNFVSISENKLRKYLIEAIDNEDDFVDWCVDMGYIGNDSITKANRDYYIGD